jgi:hypothetical protein
LALPCVHRASASEFGELPRPPPIPRRSSARVVASGRFHVGVPVPSTRRQTPAPTPAARMGAPGRRVRRDGPAASSGRGCARGVRRRRGGCADAEHRRRSPTPIAKDIRRRRTSKSSADVVPGAARRSSRARARRAPTSRQAAHGGAPWRSHAFTARPRRNSAECRRPPPIPCRNLMGFLVRRRSHAGVRRASSHRTDFTSELQFHRRAGERPRRRSPRAWERRGVASDATARRPRRGAVARGAYFDVGGRADVDRRGRPPTPIAEVGRRRREARRSRATTTSPTPRDLHRASARGAPRRLAKPRTDARLGAPMRSPRVGVRVAADRIPLHVDGIDGRTRLLAARPRGHSPDAPSYGEAPAAGVERQHGKDDQRRSRRRRRAARERPPPPQDDDGQNERMEPVGGRSRRLRRAVEKSVAHDSQIIAGRKRKRLKINARETKERPPGRRSPGRNPEGNWNS